MTFKQNNLDQTLRIGGDHFTLARKPVRRFRLPRKTARSVQVISAICLMTISSAGNASPLDIKNFTGIAQRCGSTVAALTLAAIAKTESRFETLVVADNTTRKSRVYQTIGEAAATAERLIANGHSVDIGMMQINSANLKRLRMTPRDVLNPCQAIQAAATILTNNYLASKSASTQQIALRNALSMYNTGNARYGYTNGYVRRVEQAALSLAPHIGPNTGSQLAMYVRPERIPATLAVSPSRIEEAPVAPNPWDVWNVGAQPTATANNDHNQTSVYVL